MSSTAGAPLRRRREALSLDVAELAHLAGVSTSAVHWAERSRGVPATAIARIEAALTAEEVRQSSGDRALDGVADAAIGGFVDPDPELRDRRQRVNLNLDQLADLAGVRTVVVLRAEAGQRISREGAERLEWALARFAGEQPTPAAETSLPRPAPDGEAMRLGQDIRRRREALFMPAPELGRRADLSASTITKAECGGGVSEVSLTKILAALDSAEGQYRARFGADRRAEIDELLADDPADAIRERRLSLGLDEDDVAELAGVSVGAVRRAESGRHVGRGTLHLIAAAVLVDHWHAQRTLAMARVDSRQRNVSTPLDEEPHREIRRRRRALSIEPAALARHLGMPIERLNEVESGKLVDGPTLGRILIELTALEDGRWNRRRTPSS